MNNSIENSPKQKVAQFLQTEEELDLLRVIICGSVDNGKSTLIGRILFEAQLVFEDQLLALVSESKKYSSTGDEINFSFLVDGLAAEREQGITIDVAYRFFGTQHRKFIAADTPGHLQYTRNMATGASTAQVAIILVDATQGILTQTRRHSFIVSLLGVRHVVLAVNKMDLIEFDKNRFQQIVEDFNRFAQGLKFNSITAIPLSAKLGDNVVQRSQNTGWFNGPTLMEFLEAIEVTNSNKSAPLRFPVQWVNRPNASFRGYSGTVVAGTADVGQIVRVLPSGEVAKISEIVLFEKKLESAPVGKAITLVLDKDIDISRGDIIVTADCPCEVSDQFQVSIVWVDQQAGFIGRSYFLKLGPTRVSCTISDIKYKYNIDTMEHLSSTELNLNDIAEVTIRLDKPIAFDQYEACHTMGAFILIDKYTFHTIAAGMINLALRRAKNIHRQPLTIDRSARETLNGHKGRLFWFTGLSGSGKSTVANSLENRLFEQGIRTYILDGDNIRHGLSNDLGFTDADRVENIRRIAEVGKLMVDAGIFVISSFISPFRSEREAARAMFNEEDFVEIYVNVPLGVAEARDPKGLYKKARKGELPNFTGIDSDYEEPVKPDIELLTSELSVDECVEKILNYIRKK